MYIYCKPVTVYSNPPSPHRLTTMESAIMFPETFPSLKSHPTEHTIDSEVGIIFMATSNVFHQ